MLPGPKKESFFKRYGSRIKTWTNRLMSCVSFGLVTASVVGAAIPIGVLVVPPSIAMIITMLVKHQPKSLDEIKSHLISNLGNNEEDLTEVIDCLTDIQTKFSQSQRTESVNVTNYVDNTEPIAEETPVTPNDGNTTQRKEVKVRYNEKTKKIEYFVE